MRHRIPVVNIVVPRLRDSYVALIAATRYLATTWLRARLLRLARDCEERRILTHAEIALRISLRLMPGDRIAVVQLAALLDEQGFDLASTDCLHEFSNRWPHDVSTHVRIAMMYCDHGQLGEAKTHLESALALCPQLPLFSSAIGRYWRYDGNLAKSVACCEQALSTGDKYDVLICLAENLADTNKKPEAVGMLERAVRLCPEIPAAYGQLALMKQFRDLEDERLIVVKQLVESDKVGPKIRGYCHFILGEVCDALGLWDEAFGHFREGHGLLYTKERFPVRALHVLTQNIISSFTAPLLSQKALAYSATQEPTLIFVVGMPRSGSTLTEQILATHPCVYGGGERYDVTRLVSTLPERIGTSTKYPWCVHELERVVSEQVANAHLANMQVVAKGATHFVDKSLSAYMHIGILSVLFPYAKFVHCRRNALDTCLSCYAKNLFRVFFSNDLKTLGQVYLAYERVMNHWDSILPGRVFHLQYEELVANPEESARKLLGYCELAWDPNCLNFHTTKRVVRTASVQQVKEPIYGSSVGRWKNYRKHIGELIAVLGER